MKKPEYIDGSWVESELREFSQGYFISEYLNVYSTKQHGFRKLAINPTTLKVHYRDAENKQKREKNHVIAAKLFVENRAGNPYVIFKDGNRNNNHVSNLMWSKTPTHNENSKTTKEYVDFNGNKILKDVELRNIGMDGHYVSGYIPINLEILNF